MPPTRISLLIELETRIGTTQADDVTVWRLSITVSVARNPAADLLFPSHNSSRMADVPPWIEERLDPELNNKLTQRHVVETMLDAERPFFSIRQLQARLKPDVSRETVRNRLKELHEIDIVAAETYPESITLYYINHPESNWPLSPEGATALRNDNPLDALSVRDFLAMRDTAGIRTLVLAGFQLSLVLFTLGAIMAIGGIGSPVSSDHEVVSAAILLFLLSLGIMMLERMASRLRGDHESAASVGETGVSES